MKLLALDFDGVLCDSAKECLINSYNSYNIAEQKNTEKSYSMEMIDSREVELFLKFRPLVRIAREYYPLWYLISKNQPIDPSMNIQEQIRIPEKKLDAFNTIFFQQRREWMKKDEFSWLYFNPLYPGIKKVLLELIKYENTYIVSSKNAPAINSILKHNQIDFPTDNIWGSDSDLDKPDIFRKLKEKNAISYSDIIFLDDNIENLMKAKELGISVFWASWGYSMVNEKKKVSENRINFVRPEEFGAWANGVSE